MAKKMITEGFVVTSCRMNPHRSDDSVIYTKFIGFLSDEKAVEEFQKTHGHGDYNNIVELGKYSPGIDLD